MSVSERGGRQGALEGFSFIHLDDLGVRVVPRRDPIVEEKLEGLVRFLGRVVEALERAGARGVRLQVDWDGGMVVVKRGRDGIYGVYAENR